MKSNIHHTPLRLTSIPSISTDSEGRTIHGYQNRTDLHYVDGWRDYVEPGFDGLTQRLGDLVYDEAKDIVTRVVIDKTAEELEAERRAMVPFSITPTQGRIALKLMGLLDNVNTMIENSEDAALKIYWEYSLSWDRQNSYISSMANLLGMTEQDLDNFFIEASQIQ